MATKTKAVKLTDRKLRTPKGQFQWAYLNKPDDSFNKSVYRTTIYFLDKKDPEYIAFIASLKRLAKEYAGIVGKPIKKISIPVKVATEKMAEQAGVPVGTPMIEAKTKAVTAEGATRGPVPVFDAKGQKDMSLQVFGGDIGRMEITVSGYDSAPPIGTGLTLYLNAVQLLKSMGRGTAGMSFEQEDAFLIDEDTDTPENEADPDEFEDEEGFDDESEEEDSDEDEDADDPTAGLL